MVYNEQSKRKMGVIHEKWTVFSIFIWTSILVIYVDQRIAITLNKGLTMKGGFIEIKSWLLYMMQLLNMNWRKCGNTKYRMSKDEQAGE